MGRLTVVLFFLVLIVPALGQEFAWPGRSAGEDPLGLGLAVDAGDGDESFGVERIFRLGSRLPDAHAERSVYEYGRNFYGVTDRLNGTEVGPRGRHRLFDAAERRLLSHGEVLPIRTDPTAPRVYDVRYSAGAQWVSLVTWRNNVVPPGTLIVQIQTADLPVAGSGVAEVAIRHRDQLVNRLRPGILAETSHFSLEPLRQGSGDFRVVPGAVGNAERILVQGQIDQDAGRSLLQVEVRDYSGNFVLLNFVLIVSENL